jgi:hypothetical protein
VLRLLVDHADAGAQLVTETNVPHDENVAYFGAGDEAHRVYQFSLAPLMLYSYVFGDASYLTTWAARLTAPPSGTTYLNFIASHDGIGLRPLEGLVPESDVERLVDAMHQRGGFVTMRDAGEAQRPYEINIALFSAFGGLEHPLAAYLGAHTLLLSFQGVPALYIHSLLATENDVELVEQTGHTRSINRSHRALADLEPALADSTSVQAQVLGHLEGVIARRARQPAFALDARQTVFPSPPGAYVMHRSSAAQTLTVIASVRAEPQRLAGAALGLDGGAFIDRLTDETIEVHDALDLEPYQVRWLERC